MTTGRALLAQQKSMPVICFLGVVSPGPYAPYVVAFHEGLSEAGYVEGKISRSNTVGQRAGMISSPH
jgi:hypothetical protein